MRSVREAGGVNRKTDPHPAARFARVHPPRKRGGIRTTFRPAPKHRAPNPVQTSCMSPRKRETFYGWRVVAAAFVLAVFGWGLGFYGPPVYLHAVREARGFSLTVASAAVTTHFLFGAIMVANLPRLYRRFGVGAITTLAAVSLALGVIGWAIAKEPWQLFAATVFSGAGWVAMSAAAVNAILSPWFVRKRPAALATAYNGASIGGVIFSPLAVAAISLLGFPLAAAVIGVTMIIVVFVLAHLYFSKTPDAMGLAPDGDEPGGPPASVTSPHAKPLPGALLLRDFRFITLAAGMTLGLFAQVGLVAHLFSLLVPALGAQAAGLLMGGATVAAIAGRTLVGWLMPANADRRLVASASYGVQIIGSLVLFAAAGSQRAAPHSRRDPVRLRHRQRHVAAAPDRAGGIRERRRRARRPPHCRHLAGDFRLRARRVRAHSRVRATFRRPLARRRARLVHCGGADSGPGDCGVPDRPAVTGPAPRSTVIAREGGRSSAAIATLPA